MARMSGADADELEALGHRMVAAADRLNGIRDEVTAVVRQAQWDGDDALQFRDLWQFRLSALLQAATAATRDASVVVIRNAEQQRFASGADPSITGRSPHGGGSGTSTAGDRDRPDVPGMLLGSLSALAGLAIDAGKLRAWMQATDKVAKWANEPFIKNLDKFAHNPLLKVAGTSLKVVDVVVDGVGFVSGIANQDWDRVKLSGVDLALTGITAGAMIAFPPAGLVLGGAQVGWSLVPDDVKLDVINGVGDVAAAAWDGAGDVVEDVGGAVTNLAQGGFNALGDVFGW